MMYKKIVFSLLSFMSLSLLNASAPLPKIQGVLTATSEKIQPGTPIEFVLKLQNTGEVSSTEGEVFIRFALIKSVAKDSKGITFETEKEKVPSLEPGKNIKIVFKKSHKLPAVVDFVREDWLLHEYQAVFVVNGKENVVTVMPLTCSVHYYPVFKQKTPPVELK